MKINFCQNNCVKNLFKIIGYGAKNLIKTIMVHKKTAIIIFFMVALSIVLGIFFLKPEPHNLNLFEAEIINLYQEIDLTGKVKASENISLGFERPGRVVAVRKQPGDKVAAGEIIALLDNSALNAELVRAKAAVKLAEIELANILKGVREEELNIQRTATENARLSLEIAESDLSDVLKNEKGKIEEIMINKIDRFFRNPKTNPDLIFKINNLTLESQLENNRRKLTSSLKEWENAKYVGDKASLSIEVISFIRNISNGMLVMFGEEVITSHSQRVIDEWRAEMEEVRLLASSIGTTITNTRSRYVGALNHFMVEEKDLALKTAGPTSFQADSASAKLESAKAAVEIVEAEINKGKIVSPISGIIGKINAIRGETASLGSIAAIVMSDKKFQIETYIPEADIAKIEEGNFAEVTLDAYGADVVFKAKVISINPGETIVDGVTAYKAIIEFIEENDRIKSGMTASINIMGDKRENVIAIPQRAIINENNKRYVNLFKDGSVIKIEVKTGFRGTGGRVEIIEGLNKGDKVVLP